MKEKLKTTIKFGDTKPIVTEFMQRFLSIWISGYSWSVIVEVSFLSQLDKFFKHDVINEIKRGLIGKQTFMITY